MMQHPFLLFSESFYSGDIYQVMQHSENQNYLFYNDWRESDEFWQYVGDLCFAEAAEHRNEKPNIHVFWVIDLSDFVDQWLRRSSLEWINNLVELSPLDINKQCQYCLH